MSPLFAAVIIIFAATIIDGDSAVSAFDRYELGRVLKIMPPNGPAEKYGNLAMRKKSRKAGMAPAVFPHWLHRARFTCSVCHGELEIAMRAGANGINREGCLAGRFCGACHDGRTAFGVQKDGGNCDRCHMRDTARLDDRFRQFAAMLPSSEHGNRIDWGEAMKRGLITPKNSLAGNKPLPQLPVALKNPLALGVTRSSSAATFSHEEHNAEMDCAVCHPDIFNVKKKGTQYFSMETNVYGQFCGACHMRIAFPMNDCRRCHPSMSNFSM